ncbi:DUF1769-domain-containing protein [Mycena metata]|uniref:DUF1769-domain-containing protein n=1 Tax=Mycena metata TaxID=1033252 RepID=A0AAD7P095_9AGAR|nr:DUF1769-domain-containing protein [Mycena metata]
MPKLRVLAGPTPHTLTPYYLAVVVHINFNQEDPSLATPEEAEYFGRDDRSGVTWSIQVQGRFLAPRSADDILFGNIFERPLKLPWGTGAALKFMKYIDPTLSHDLTCTATQKPWALSPLVATMPYLKHTRLASSPSCNQPNGVCTSPCSHSDTPPFPPPKSVTDDTSLLHLAAVPIEESGELHSRSSTPSSSSSGSSSSLSSRSSKLSFRSSDSKKSKKKRKSAAGNEVPRDMTSQQRRSYFSNEVHRKGIVLGPQDIITTDFCYGFLEFAPSLRLRLPGGLAFDLAKYWDGQGVRFVCCERRHVSSDHSSPLPDDNAEGEQLEDDEDPWGRVFWCVSIEIDEDEEG